MQEQKRFIDAIVALATGKLVFCDLFVIKIFRSLGAVPESPAVHGYS